MHVSSVCHIYIHMYVCKYMSHACTYIHMHVYIYIYIVVGAKSEIVGQVYSLEIPGRVDAAVLSLKAVQRQNSFLFRGTQSFQTFD